MQVTKQMAAERGGGGQFGWQCVGPLAVVCADLVLQVQFAGEMFLQCGADFAQVTRGGARVDMAKAVVCIRLILLEV